MKIRIELESDTAPGAGEGEVGGVDRDITHEANGLPIINARRIKGCLREAALEVQDALGAAGREDLLPEQIITALFGSSYSQNSRPGYLQLSDAKLAEAGEMRDWLKWASQSNIFNPTAILDNYTGLRTQTSIARVTGGPLSNSLRVGRVIHKGCVFVAEAHLEKPMELQTDFSETQLRQVLAWACAALRHIGLSRNRGLGHVRVTLQDDTYDSEQALNDLADLLNVGGRAG